MILPKTTPEQRSKYYADLDALLSPGFLTHPMTVAGVRLQLRSLGPGDLFMLKARTVGGTGRAWRVWAVATGIWMINGRSVLGQDDAVPFLAQYLENLPSPVLNTLFSTILGLWVRVTAAVDDAEAFVYEPQSRYKWKSSGRMLHHPGVPGADRLGLNTVQRIWVAFNETEDTRREEESTWEGIKFVASSNAPKAVGKIDDKDRQRRADEQDQRQRRLDQFYYEKIGLMVRDPETGAVPTTSHRLATKSVEDLEDEMRRWVTGDADAHDRVVEEYKARIRAQQEQDRAERAARRIALEAERERQAAEAEEGGFVPQPLMALTAEQLQQMLQERGMGRPGTTFIPAAPQAERVYNRYLREGAVIAGNLAVDEGKVRDPQAHADTDVRTLKHLIKGQGPAEVGG